MGIETLIFDDEQKIDSARDIINDDINNTARELVLDILREAFEEVQNDANSIENMEILPKLNASLSEDQYSGQLSSRNNTPAKIRRLSENQQICDDSPLTKKLPKDEDSDVETPLPQTLSTEILKKSNEFCPSSMTITPAVVPEKVDVHDISTWSSLDDSARELVPRPSVRENLEDTTLEARKSEVVDKINQQQEMLQLLKEQYQAKTKIYEEIIKLSEEEIRGGEILEGDESNITNNSSGISGRQIRTSTTSTGTIKAPLTTIETYLPTEVSTESMACELNSELSKNNSSIPGTESNLSVSKTSQESGSSYSSKASDQTIGRTMMKTEDRRSINMAKEKTVKEDTRVIVSHTTQNEKSKKSVKAKKETTEEVLPVSKPPADRPSMIANLNESIYATPKINMNSKLEQECFETPKLQKTDLLTDNKNLGSTSNISTGTFESGRATPTMGKSTSPGKRDNKGRRQNRRRGKKKAANSKSIGVN